MVSRATRSEMAGELKNRYLRGKTGLRATSLEESFNTDMSSHGTSSRRQAETRKKLQASLSKMLALLRTAMHSGRIERLSCRRFGIDFSWRSAVASIARSDAFKVQSCCPCQSVVSTQLAVHPQPLVQGPSCSPELHKRGLCISSSCLGAASKLDPWYVSFSNRSHLQAGITAHSASSE